MSIIVNWFRGVKVSTLYQPDSGSGFESQRSQIRFWNDLINIILFIFQHFLGKKFALNSQTNASDWQHSHKSSFCHLFVIGSEHKTKTLMIATVEKRVITTATMLDQSTTIGSSTWCVDNLLYRAHNIESIRRPNPPNIKRWGCTVRFTTPNCKLTALIIGSHPFDTTQSTEQNM